MAIVTEALAGRDNRDMTSSNREVPHYLDNLTTDISNLKIGVLTTVSNEVRNEEVKKTFENVVETLKSLGATVEDVEMDKKLMKTLLPTYTIIANSEATSNHSCLDGVKYGDRQQGDTPDDVMINSRTDGFGNHIKRRFILGNLALATENQEKMFRKAQRVRRLVVDELNKIYENYDIIIAPNGGGVAPLIDEATEDYLSDEYIILENWLCLANFAGTPSISIPSGFVDNMPVAVNISGRIFEEQTVLNCAYALEEALGFKNQYKRGGLKMDYERVIGLEVHCELKTNSRCSLLHQLHLVKDPNTMINEVDMGMTGTLPCLNKKRCRICDSCMSCITYGNR